MKAVKNDILISENADVIILLSNFTLLYWGIAD